MDGRDSSSTLAAELQSLLAPLTDGEAPNTREESFREQDCLALFEKHIGPYQEVLDNAARHAQNLWRDEVFCFKTGCEPVNYERYLYPRFGRINGPRPDVSVWVGLFFGREEQGRLKDEKLKADTSGGIEVYSILEGKLCHDVKTVSAFVLTRNVLRYLREKAGRLPNANAMLRFCALYGLSGAITDVLGGKYGSSDEITIDSLLSFREHDAPQDDMLSHFTFDDMFMPAWAFGAALGYRNVVQHCIRTLGAKTEMHLVMKMKGSGEMKETESLPGLMLHWSIMTNQSEMLSCLVSECGFQFRWLCDQMEELFEILFHIDRMNDEFGVWRSPRYDPHEFAFESRSRQRQFRAKCCYEEKQMMLKTMIEVGFPRQLFLPELNVDIERNITLLMEKKGSEGSDEPTGKSVKDLFDSLSPLEDRARRKLFEAASEYNEIQSKKRKQLTLLDFYERTVKLLENRSTAQESRLAEFEMFDPRWKKHETQGEGAFTPWWGRKSDYSSDEYDSDY